MGRQVVLLVQGARGRTRVVCMEWPRCMGADWPGVLGGVWRPIGGGMVAAGVVLMASLSAVLSDRFYGMMLQSSCLERPEAR